MGGFHIIKIITSFCVTFKGAFEQKPQFSCCENYQNPFAEKNYYVHIGFSQQQPICTFYFVVVAQYTLLTNHFIIAIVQNWGFSTA